MEYANNAAKMPLAETARRIRNVGNLPGTLMPPRKMKKKKTHTHTHNYSLSGSKPAERRGRMYALPSLPKTGKSQKKKKEGFRGVYGGVFTRGHSPELCFVLETKKKIIRILYYVLKKTAEIFYYALPCQKTMNKKVEPQYIRVLDSSST